MQLVICFENISLPEIVANKEYDCTHVISIFEMSGNILVLLFFLSVEK